MNCALKTLVDKRDYLTDLICGLKLEIESMESSDTIDSSDETYIQIGKLCIARSRIDLIDLRNAIRAIENGALSNE